MKKETSDFVGKSIRKDFSAKKKGKDTQTFEDRRPTGSEPYKKPKTHFRHYLEEMYHLDGDDDDFDEDL
jgi:hypothetical protein